MTDAAYKTEHQERPTLKRRLRPVSELVHMLWGMRHE